MFYDESERTVRRAASTGRRWSWHDQAPQLLLGVAFVALLLLVVALALGWIL